ncbi:MAG: 1-acyl-sn-glycerol-3-phosphate acyltransferase [Saprospiraceae bacterium]|nr:1-acyl-sn-glycerol-3-phosphate acyltransferase [Saprospiraceae bacterium]
MSWIYKMIFRKIHVNNSEGIPVNSPVILAANHPTAFIDPIFFTINFAPPVYNMTRGDVFEKPFMDWLFRQFNMFPVYRKRDGYSQGNRNDSVFEYCKERMRQRNVVNIFVEGEHHLDKRVITLQKGFARIAFGSYTDLKQEDLQIIPVGCAYHDGVRMRDIARINVGQPIFVKDYFPAAETEPAFAINRLCNDVRGALKQLCYHIENKMDDQLADQLLMLHQSDHYESPIGCISHNHPAFNSERLLLESLNKMDEASKGELKTACQNYFEELQKVKLTDSAIVQPEFTSMNRTLLVILGFVPFIVTWLLTYPVRLLVRILSKKLVKKPEFHTSAVLGLTFLLGLFYSMTGIIAGYIMDNFKLIMLFLTSPMSGIYTLIYEDLAKEWLQGFKAKTHPHREKLLAMRPVLSTIISP